MTEGRDEDGGSRGLDMLGTRDHVLSTPPDVACGIHLSTEVLSKEATT